MSKRKTEDYINKEIKKHGRICFPLIDSEKTLDGVSIAKIVERIGASAILIGGSSAIDQLELSQLTSSIKAETKIPVILFPGNVTGVGTEC